MANTYQCSNGTRLEKTVIDQLIKKAKAKKYQFFLEEHDYIFCEDCKRNDCKPVDLSHTISVDEAQKTSKSELAFDIHNIRFRGRDCHKKLDKLNTQFNWAKVDTI